MGAPLRRLQQAFEPATFISVPRDGEPEASRRHEQPQPEERLPSHLSADPVIAGMQIGNFIAAAIYGARGEHR